MGRQKGSLNRGYGRGKWNPVKWRADHEVVVLLHVSGKSNKEIATSYGKTEQWVSLVINCERAKETIDKIRKNLPVDQVSRDYASMIELAKERVATFLADDDFAKKNPGAMFDRAIRAIDVIDNSLKKVGGQGGGITNNINAVVLTTEENSKRIADALDRSAKVTMLHRSDPPLKLVAGEQDVG